MWQEVSPSPLLFTFTLRISPCLCTMFCPYQGFAYCHNGKPSHTLIHDKVLKADDHMENGLGRGQTKREEEKTNKRLIQARDMVA